MIHRDGPNLIRNSYWFRFALSFESLPMIYSAWARFMVKIRSYMQIILEKDQALKSKILAQSLSQLLRTLSCALDNSIIVHQVWFNQFLASRTFYLGTNWNPKEWKLLSNCLKLMAFAVLRNEESLFNRNTNFMPPPVMLFFTFILTWPTICLALTFHLN